MADLEAMAPSTMAIYAGICGWTLARAHPRSGDRIAIAAYLGKGAAFDQAIGHFAELCAGQNERDYRALVDAAKTKRITVASGLWRPRLNHASASAAWTARGQETRPGLPPGYAPPVDLRVWRPRASLASVAAAPEARRAAFP